MVASAPNLCLLRTIAVGSEAAEKRGTRRSNNTFLSRVASAVFWPHSTGTTSNEFKRDPDADAGVTTACDPGTRILQGELFVPFGTKQSFTFPRFACSVSQFLFFLVKICLGNFAQAETKQIHSIPLLYYHLKWLVSSPQLGQQTLFLPKVSP